ncbi:MAG: NAD(+) diphosphatase [Rhodospirillaceae bacterium]|nr:NAD(+) diphosphatase [Rhodospirillaceae bacterium]
MRRANILVHPDLDRVAHLRGDGGWLAARLGEAATRLYPVWRNQSFVTGPQEAPVAATIPADAGWWRPIAAETALMGTTAGAVHMAVDVGDLEDPARHPGLAARGRFADLRMIGGLMPDEDAALCAHARAILWWNRQHRFCGACGGATTASQAGYARRCGNPACGIQHFPRTDAAVIVLIHDGDRILLGRQRGWPHGMHSVLAGFLEPGESLEGCVAREVKEESGIDVTDIRYHSSQPWPFPQSLMVGFTARAVTTTITVDPEELETAGWYARDFLAAAPREPRRGADFYLPRRISIARRLIEDWLAGEIEL